MPESYPGYWAKSLRNFEPSQYVRLRLRNGMNYIGWLETIGMNSTTLRTSGTDFVVDYADLVEVSEWEEPWQQP